MVAIRESFEAARGCGYRKKGGLYMVGGRLSAPCGRLPMPLDVCPTCHSGIKFSRGWTWIDPRPLVEKAGPCRLGKVMTACPCALCPMGDQLPEKAGLLWIGEKFYATTAKFLNESAMMGVSRRISAVPRDFKVGETWVMLAHRKAIFVPDDGDEVVDHYRPGLFAMFKPSKVEYVVKGTETPEQLEKLEERGLSLVDVKPQQGELDLKDDPEGEVG